MKRRGIGALEDTQGLRVPLLVKMCSPRKSPPKQAWTGPLRAECNSRRFLLASGCGLRDQARLRCGRWSPRAGHGFGLRRFSGLVRAIVVLLRVTIDVEMQSFGIQCWRDQVARRGVVVRQSVRSIRRRIVVSDVGIILVVVVRRPGRVPIRVVPPGVPSVSPAWPPVAAPIRPAYAEAPTPAEACSKEATAPTVVVVSRPIASVPAVATPAETAVAAPVPTVPMPTVAVPTPAAAKSPVAESVVAAKGIEARAAKQVII